MPTFLTMMFKNNNKNSTNKNSIVRATLQKNNTNSNQPQRTTTARTKNSQEHKQCPRFRLNSPRRIPTTSTVSINNQIPTTTTASTNNQLLIPTQIVMLPYSSASSNSSIPISSMPTFKTSSTQASAFF